MARQKEIEINIKMVEDAIERINKAKQLNTENQNSEGGGDTAEVPPSSLPQTQTNI